MSIYICTEVIVTEMIIQQIICIDLVFLESFDTYFFFYNHTSKVPKPEPGKMFKYYAVSNKRFLG